MNSLFEFGEYWDTGTFILFFVAGLIIARLAHRGANIEALSHPVEEKQYKKGLVLSYKLNIYYSFIYLILLLLYSLRSSEVGADTASYVSAFHNANSFNLQYSLNNLISQREPLFQITTYIIRKITDSYTIYLLCYGIIIASAYTRFIKSFWNTNNSFIMIIGLMVEYHYGLNVMRTALGMAFVLMSLCEIKKEKWIKAIIVGIIGVLFHYSAFIHIPLIILFYVVSRRERLSRKKIILLIAASIGIIIAGVPLLSNYFLATRYHGYVERASSGTLLGYWYIILSIGLSIILLLKNREKDAKSNILIFTTLYNVILLLLNYLFGAYRLTNLYVAPRLCLWDTLPQRFKSPQHRVIIRSVLFISLIVYMLFRMSRNSNPPGFAYKFFWE